MRVIGHLENEQAARRFGDFLFVHGIINTVEREEPAWAIWVHDDDQLTKAGQWLTTFRANPSDRQFDTAKKAQTIREEEKEDLKEFQKRFKTRQDVFRRSTVYGMGKLTVLLIALSVAVSIISNLGKNLEPISSLFMVQFAFDGTMVSWMPGLQEIRQGQVWRLITPIFIHFGPVHILFNMMAMKDLGSAVEGVEGTLRLLFLVLVIAVGSNLAQYLVQPKAMVFGGMSGVLFGLFGYIWMKSKFDPFSGFQLHKNNVIMMLGWLVLCFTGVMGNIANTVHVAGLLLGMAIGFVASKLRRA